MTNSKLAMQTILARLRAKNRVCVLLAELARAIPQTANLSGLRNEPMSDDMTRAAESPYAEALTTNGISRQTSHRYQALATVTSTVLVLRRSTKQKTPALWLGRIHQKWHA